MNLLLYHSEIHQDEVLEESGCLFFPKYVFSLTSLANRPVELQKHTAIIMIIFVYILHVFFPGTGFSQKGEKGKKGEKMGGGSGVTGNSHTGGTTKKNLKFYYSN